MTRSEHPVKVIAVTTFVTEVLMIVTDMGPRLMLMTALCVLVGVGIWFVVGLGRAAVRSEMVSEPHPPPPSQIPDLRITLLRQGLSYGRHDNQIPERMYRTMVELIDDELVVSHGIDRVADPSSARAVIGDDLMRFVERPIESRTLSLDGLALVVGLIEGIRTEVST